MQIVPLEWDSAFFGRTIGRIDINSSSDEPILESILKHPSEFELIYIFSPEQVLLNLPEQDPRCKLVDQKIVFSFDLSICTEFFQPSIDLSIEEYNSTSIDPNLEELAYQSGVYSRFRLDTNFRPNDFFQLYRKWLENSVNRTIADKIFVVRSEMGIIAFVTAMITLPTATIGLLAVSESVRGKNIGTSLMHFLFAELKRVGAETLFVATQLQNEGSCRFYKKVGFVKHSITNIYHYWR